MFACRPVLTFLLIISCFLTCFAQENPRTDRRIENIIIQDNLNRDIQVSSISFHYFSEIYNQLASEQRIPFAFPDDGCFAKAHKTSLILDRLGIISVKSFIVGDLKLFTSNSPYGFVDWWYHVAPAVHIKDTDELYVFDPTSSERPISKFEWMEMLTQHTDGHIDESFETERFIYRPEDAYKGTRLNDYQTSDLYLMQQSLIHSLNQLHQRSILSQSQQVINENFNPQ